MKIATNVQPKKLGGMARVFSSLSAFVERSGVLMELVPLAVTSRPDAPAGVTPWEDYVDGRLRGYAARTNTALYPAALAASTTLEELAAALSPLTRAYEDALRRIGPDLVLVNGTYYRPWCLRIAARSLGLPVVVQYHGSAVRESEGMVDPRALPLVSAIERDVLSGALRVLFPSTLAQAQAPRVTGMDSVQSVIIPNAVPDIFFAAQGAHDARSLGFILRWEQVKNTRFVEAFISRNETLPEPYTLSLISDIHDDPVRRPVSPHLTVRPAYDTLALATFYASQAAVICPSVFETFGNVAAEAVASGTPAIVSRAMGVSEVFASVGMERLIVDFSEPDALFAQLPAIIRQGIAADERARLKMTLAEETVMARVTDVLLNAMCT